MTTRHRAVTTRRRDAGLTLVEVLVAATLLAIFVAACASAFSLAARLQREATAIARRTAAFEPFVVAAGHDLASLSSCSALAAPSEAAVCRLEAAHCRVATGVLRCDGGGLLRVRIAWREADGGPAGAPLEAWAEGTP